MQKVAGRCCRCFEWIAVLTAAYVKFGSLQGFADLQVLRLQVGGKIPTLKNRGGGQDDQFRIESICTQLILEDWAGLRYVDVELRDYVAILLFHYAALQLHGERETPVVEGKIVW